MAEQRQIRIPPNRTAGSDTALTPKDIAGILRRHILLIVLMTFIGIVIGGVGWFLMKRYFPKYTASTYIKVLPPVERDPTTIGGMVVNKDIQYGHRLSIASLIKQQSTLQKLLTRDKIQDTEWFKNFGEQKDKRFGKAFKKLKKSFSVSASRDAEFVSLSMQCADKKESALIVNEMVEMFLNSQGSTKRAEISDRLSKLETRRSRLQGEVRSAEAALEEVSRQRGFSNLMDSGNIKSSIAVKLENLELQQSDLTMQIESARSLVETLEKQALGPINEQVGNQIERDPLMTALAQQIALREAALAGVLTKFGERHRVVRQTQELINEIKEKRRIRRIEIAEQTRQANLKNTQDQLTMLLDTLEGLEMRRDEALQRQKDYDQARTQFEQRVVIRDERRAALDSIKAQIDKLKIMFNDPETPKVQFVGHAPEPLEISSPRWEIYFPGGMMLGLMFGIGLAFLIEMLNDLVRMPRDVGRHLHIPLLGVIPDAQEDDTIDGIDPVFVVRRAPYSMLSESYRQFRTNFKLSEAAESSKVLLITSAMAGDGKTSAAVNLAMTFAAENKKVLLIDSNFWRPTTHQIFPEKQTDNDASERPRDEFGLSTFLRGLCGYQEIIRPTGIEGFNLIDAGLLPPNAAELIGSSKMQQLLKHQRENYDYIIVDGPPVLLVSDVKSLARLVEATILVFHAGTTRRGVALRTIRELKAVRANVIGCVLFAVRSMKGGYFVEQFKSYQKYHEELQLTHST